MKPIDPDILMAALAEALETMAFIAVEPPDGMPDAPALQVSLDFSGTVNGQLVLCAPSGLGAAIAANLAAVEAAGVSLEMAQDALRELVNVTAGVVLRQICAPEEMPQLSIPCLSNSSSDMPVDCNCVAALSADGHLVTATLRIAE